jgi:hypothetical protein
MTTDKQKNVDGQAVSADHVASNYAAFRRVLPNIIDSHRGRYALMCDGNVEGFYQTYQDACLAGDKYLESKGKKYSVQEVTNRKVDLGFYSHVVDRF